MKKLIAALLVLVASGAIAQQKVVQLYNGAAPGSESWTWDEKQLDNDATQTHIVYNVSHPSLTVFPVNENINTGTAVIVCPGGGFHLLSINSEGNDVAKWLNQKGITAFVLKVQTCSYSFKMTLLKR